MTPVPTCPICGKPVPESALNGICPVCLLRAGAAADTGEVGPNGTLVVKAPMTAPLAPAEIAAHFPQLEILACLGRGGMGVVYQARQPQLNRLVALKILAPEKESDPKFAERFTREAQALARLNHPNIVTVHDFGVADGLYFLLMEFVDGTSLRELLRGGKMKPEQALAVVPKICEALQFAHERGIVHRDIKPENVLLDKEGRVKIADFGIAKILNPLTRPAGTLSLADGARDGVRGSSLTQDQVVGTPHYMAPEQIEKPQMVDHRADIYSLGVVFYEMLTGELPLGKFQPPSGKAPVDTRLDSVVMHALEKEPERRYQHASEVKTDVETIANTPASGSREAGVNAEPSGVQARRAARKTAGFLFAAGCFLVSTILFAVKAWTQATFGFAGGCALLNFAGTVGFAVAAYRCWRHAKPVDESSHSLPIEPPILAKAVLIARWTARVFGTLLLAFYGFFVLGEGLPPIAAQPEGVQLNFIALGVMLAGFIVGWKREGTAALLIASGWTLWQIAESNVRWNLFSTPLPVAALYAFCWWATRGRPTRRFLTATAVLAAIFVVGRLLCPANVFIDGVVIDAVTGEPIPAAELIYLRAGQPRDKASRPNARSAQNGRFHLYVGWYSPGQQLTITASGYETLQTNFGPRPAGVRRLTRSFQLGPVTSPARLVVPPVVVQTIPESGSAEVNPNLTELRITFSAPMANDKLSLVAMDNVAYPEATGAPRFIDDGRTCALPVKLQPGKVYALWLKRDATQDSRDRTGQPAVPYLLVFETRK